jgi:methylmalonyl-CoA epimerase
MQTRARKDGEYYVLNGTKNWISNGGEAGVYLVFATLEGEDDRTAAFLVPSWAWGLRTGAKEKKLGIRASSTTQVFLEDCRVGAENLLGKEGDGFKIAMATLDGGRIGVAAQALGIAQAAFDAAVAYAKERQAFGHPIAEFQGIQWMLADMHTRIEQSRLLTYQAALLEAKGRPFAKEAAMAKLSASETAMWVTTKAIQIHGGYGYSREYPVQRYFRDAKITEIYEGTSEIQRMVIARHVLRDDVPAPVAAPSEVDDAAEGAVNGEHAVRETQTPVLELPPTPEELARMRAVKKLHHVAVAVDSVDEALRFYRDVLGLEDITTMTLEDRGLKIGLVKAGVSEIELLEPTNQENTVQRFLDRRGPGLHHVCFEVDDVEASMRHFESRGAEFLDPVPRPGAVGLVSFMPPSVADGVLVELAQTSGYTLPSDGEVAMPDALAPTFVRATVRSAPSVPYSRPGLSTATSGGVEVRPWRAPRPAEPTPSPDEPSPPPAELSPSPVESAPSPAVTGDAPAADDEA